MRNLIRTAMQNPSSDFQFETSTIIAALIFACLAFAPLVARGDFKDDIGFTQLQTQYGSALPTGTGVRLAQIEYIRDGNWKPDTSGELSGKSLTYSTSQFGSISSHANEVAAYLLGSTTSITPGVTGWQAYEATNYIGTGSLKGGRTLAPLPSTWDVENHSWGGVFANDNINITRKLDHRIESENVIAAVGIDNASSLSLLLAQGYNAITVGTSTGNHPVTGTTYEGAGRHKPDLVGTAVWTSYATPIVASCATLLIGKINADSSLAAARNPRVIKAILMAGATKSEFPNWSRTTSAPLDATYGAGEVNIYNSYHILVAGQKSASTNAHSTSGWDNTTTGSSSKFYRLTVPSGKRANLSAILTWHRRYNVPSASADAAWFTMDPITLANLDLVLWNANNAFTATTELTRSASTIDNVEHTYSTNLPAGNYLFEVAADTSSERYGLAWNMELSDDPNGTPQPPVVPAPTISSFSAASPTLTVGNSTTLNWSTSGATSLSISPTIGNVSGLTSTSVSPASTTTYTLTATNASGSVTSTASITVNPAPIPAPTISSFSAVSPTLTVGNSTTLNWSTSGATSLSISPSIGNVSGLTSTSVSPASTTTYTLTATNASGSVTSTASITVNPAPIPAPTITSFSAASPTLTVGNSTTLNWSTSGATSLSISPTIGNVSGLTSTYVSPASTTTYTLTATNASGSVTSTTSITVNPAPVPVPTISSFSVSSPTITVGNSTTLNWSTSGATSLSISPTIGNVSGLTSTSVSPASTTTYTLTATNASGSVTSTASITVNPAPAPTPPPAPSPSPAPPPLPTINSFSASATTITLGTSVVFNWSTSDTTYINLWPTSVNNSTASSTTITPTGTTTYFLIAYGPGGSSSSSITITVNPAPAPAPTPPPAPAPAPVPAPTINSFSASSASLPAGGGNVTLSWSTSNATSLSLAPVGTVTGNSRVVSVTSTATFTLTATNASGSTSVQTTIFVADPAPAPAPAPTPPPAPTPTAATYYISNSGNNSNNGLSTAAAFATLQYAADRAIPGDVFLVSDGNYAGFNLTRNGAAGQPITFRASGNAARITSANAFTNQDGINIEGADYVVLEGLISSGHTRAGIRLVNSDGSTVTRTTCQNNGRWGIFTGFTHDLTLSYNHCSGSVAEHGIYVSNSSDRARILNNHVHHNRASGIQINADLSQGGDGISSDCLIANNLIYENGLGGGAAINLDGATSAHIANNLLYENHATGIALFRIDAAVPSRDAKIYHNTIVQASDARWAILAVDGSTGAVLHNNILLTQHATRGSVALDTASRTGLVSNYNLLTSRLSLDAGNTVQSLTAWQSSTGQDVNSSAATSVDTPFVNRAAADFSLAAFSPAINTGRTLIYVSAAADRNGVARPQGLAPDLGSEEQTNVGAPVSVPVITTQPASQSLATGATLTLSVTASGSSLTYQWFKDNVALTGATSSTYSKSANTADAGAYTVRVANSAGQVTSNAAALTVTTPAPTPEVPPTPMPNNTPSTPSAPSPASSAASAAGGGGGSPSFLFLGALALLAALRKNRRSSAA